MVTDSNGSIRYVNHAFEAITGYAAHEVLGQNPRLLKSDEQDPWFYQQLWQTIQDGEIWRGQLVNKRRDGTLYTARSTIVPVLNTLGAVVQFVCLQEDVTGEIELQRRLARAETLEVVGQLAAGVAHDFNNILAVVVAYVELLADSLASDDERQRDLTELTDTAMRGAGLVRQLLLFSHESGDEPEPLDLDAAVTEVAKMLGRTIGEDLDLHLDLAGDLPPILASRVQLQQVLMNLAVNARDAMPKGGKLRLETRLLPRADALLEPDEPDEVLLSVSDTGCGMAPEVAAHIFEPYFTTKESRGGTGLGLATVYGIVTKSGGRIEVHSAPGAGTCFELFFPALSSPVAPRDTPQAAASAKGRGETILVAEDDAFIRGSLVRMLTRHGYHVLAASNGARAMELVAAHDATVALLLTDVVMPVMSGPVLAMQLRQRWPSLKVVFMSGYADQRVFDHGLTLAEAHFVHKPFSPADLRRRIRDVLDE
jgi:PAS domain S-box-containing protein